LKDDVNSVKHLIVMGDMNDSIPRFGDFGTSLFGRRLIGRCDDPTCCDLFNVLSRPSMRWPFDHIFSNAQNHKYLAFSEPQIPASDHLPVIAEITFNEPIAKPGPVKRAAFDYDGIIHRDVSQPDENGQRHPIPGLGPEEYKRFEAIYKIIQEKQTSGYEIYIITARDKFFEPSIKSVLTRFGLSNITIVTNSSPKSKALRTLKINEFYDDSDSNLREIVDNISTLPDLKKLYKGMPESNTIELIFDRDKQYLKPFQPVKRPVQAPVEKSAIIIGLKGELQKERSRLNIGIPDQLGMYKYVQNILQKSMNM